MITLISAREKQILGFAILIRILIVIWSLFTSKIVSDYDTSDIVLENLSPSHIGRSLSHWDSVYFLEIAENGYKFEHFHAFFPVFPLLIFCTSTGNTFIISGILISNLSFIFSTILMYRLSLQILKDENLSFTSTLLYSVNPASIFLSSVYTESSYALFSLIGLNFFNKKTLFFKFLAAIFFSLASGTRSNGMILAGFFIYEFLFSKKSLKNTIILFIQILIIFAPYLSFQYFGYLRYCNLNTQRPDWCNDLMPNMYNYVQKTYWNVGFLNYYETKQIPNFLLASPMIIISFSGIYTYYTSSSRNGYFSPDNLVFIFYWNFLLMVVLLNAHIQIITRLFASLPPLFWFISHLFLNSHKFSQWILGYFIFYSLLGTVLFSNFYPWT